MAYDPPDRYSVLFGGCGQRSTFSDTWSFSQGVWTDTPWKGPPAREFPSMVYDAADGYVLLYGGDYLGVGLNDTWTFSHGKWSEINGTGTPPARTRAAMSYDAGSGSVVLFGGYNTSKFLDVSDTWQFSGGIWSKVSPTNGTRPAPRDTATMTWDPAENASVLFGGFSQKNLAVLNDTWTFRSGGWDLLAPSGPTPRAREGASAVFDPDLNGTVLFGGDWVFGVLQDLWEFHSGGWTQLGYSGPPDARTGAALVWDGADDYGLLFGGNETPLGGSAWAVNDSFSLGPNFTASLVLLPSVIDFGQNSTFRSRTVSNGTPTDAYEYTSLPPGCNTADSAILVCTPNHVGTYAPIVNVTASWGGVHALYSSNASLIVHASPSIVRLTAKPAVISYNEAVTITATPSGGTDPLTYLYSGLPPGCPDSPLASLTCTPYGSVPGGYPHTFSINVTVTDSLGEQNYSMVSVTVNPDPSVYPGSFLADPAITDTGMLTQFSATASGGTGPLSFNYTGLPPGCLSQNLSQLLCRPQAPGTYAVGLTITDSTGYATPPVLTTLTVQAPPVFPTLNVSPVVVDAGQQVFVKANASGGTGGLQYSYSGLPKGCDSGGNAEFICVPTAPGDYAITGTAVDSVGGNASRSTYLTVLADPTFTSFSASPGAIDVTQSFRLSSSWTGGQAPFSFGYSGLPAGCPSANLSNLLCETSAQTKSGSYTIHLTATDSFGETASSVLTLQVNPDPRIQAFAAVPASLEVGQSTVLTVRTTGGTLPFSYSYSGLPAGCAPNDTAELRCAPELPGSYRVTVVVNDSAAYSMVSDLSFQVTNASVGPAPIGPVEAGGAVVPNFVYAAAAAAVLGAILLLLFLRRQRTRPAPEEVYDAEGDDDGVPPDTPVWEPEPGDPAEPTPASDPVESWEAP